jgi:tight adherence protein C
MLAFYYALILASAFAALFLVAYAALCVPAEPPDLLGIRGSKRVRALQDSPLFADLEPALRWCGMQLRRWVSRSSLTAIERQLMLAGDFLGLRPEEFIALCGLSAVLGGALGRGYAYFFAKSAAFAAVGAGLGALLPYSRLTSVQEERRTQVEHGLPPIIDLLVLGLSAGLDLPGALRQVVQKTSNPTDPLIEELGIVLQELHTGKTRKAALSQLAERVPTQSVRELTAAVIQAEEHGNPLARVLQIHAEVARRQRSTRAEEAAAKAGVKMMGPMVMVFAAVLLLIVGPMFLASATL